MLNALVVRSALFPLIFEYPFAPWVPVVQCDGPWVTIATGGDPFSVEVCSVFRSYLDPQFPPSVCNSRQLILQVGWTGRRKLCASLRYIEHKHFNNMLRIVGWYVEIFPIRRCRFRIRPPQQEALAPLLAYRWGHARAA